MAQYDAIAEAYQDSKQLPFRKAIERYTLFDALGNIDGMKVLDLACGEGFYTRLLKRAGAAAVTGVDVSAEMIRLADAFQEAGFRDFRWLGVSLEPDERGNPFWDDFLDNPPVIAYAATK